MMGLTNNLRIFLAIEPCDMRKSFNGLTSIADQLKPDSLKNGKQLKRRLVDGGQAAFQLLTVYRQQEIMYREKTHRIPDRIVSISQPHVRPIVRRKAGKPVEFGAKISLSHLPGGFVTLDRLSWDA